MQGKNRNPRKRRRSQPELHLDLGDEVVSPREQVVAGAGKDLRVADQPSGTGLPASSDPSSRPDRAAAPGPSAPGPSTAPDHSAASDLPSAPVLVVEVVPPPAVPMGNLDEPAGEEDPVPPPPAVFEFEDRGSMRRLRPQLRSPTLPRTAETSRTARNVPSERVVDESRELELLEESAAHSSDPSLFLKLGQTYLGLGRYNEAEEWIRRAQKLDPDRIEIRTKLGILAFRRGLYAQAEADLHWACEQDPEDGMAHLYRGETLNLLGRIDEAVQVVEVALRLNPENSRSHYLMGILLDRKNRSQEASYMYRRARELAGR